MSKSGMRGRMSGADRRGAVIAGIGALVGGLLVGTLCTFKHHVGVGVVSGSGVPVGLVAGFATEAASLAAVRLWFGRWTALAAGVGVLVAVLALTRPGPSGQDQVVLGDWVGLTWVVGAAVLVALACLWPARRRRPARPGILGRDPLPRAGEDVSS